MMWWRSSPRVAVHPGTWQRWPSRKSTRRRSRSGMVRCERPTETGIAPSTKTGSMRPSQVSSREIESGSATCSVVSRSPFGSMKRFTRKRSRRSGRSTTSAAVWAIATNASTSLTGISDKESFAVIQLAEQLIPGLGETLVRSVHRGRHRDRHATTTDRRHRSRSSLGSRRPARPAGPGRRRHRRAESDSAESAVSAWSDDVSPASPTWRSTAVSAPSGVQSHAVSRQTRCTWATVNRGASEASCASPQAGTLRTIGISWSSDSSPRRTNSTDSGSSFARSAASTTPRAVEADTPQRQARNCAAVQTPSPCHSNGLASNHAARSIKRPCWALRCPATSSSNASTFSESMVSPTMRQSYTCLHLHATDRPFR